MTTQPVWPRLRQTEHPYSTSTALVPVFLNLHLQAQHNTKQHNATHYTTQHSTALFISQSLVPFFLPPGCCPFQQRRRDDGHCPPPT